MQKLTRFDCPALFLRVFRMQSAERAQQGAKTDHVSIFPAKNRKKTSFFPKNQGDVLYHIKTQNFTRYRQRQQKSRYHLHPKVALLRSRSTPRQIE